MKAVKRVCTSASDRLITNTMAYTHRGRLNLEAEDVAGTLGASMITILITRLRIAAQHVVRCGPREVGAFPRDESRPHGVVPA